MPSRPSKSKLLPLLAAVLAGAAIPASAMPVLTASTNGIATGPFYANFDNLALGNAGGQTNGDIAVSFSGDGQTLTGALPGLSAPPYLNGNGWQFGDTEIGADTTNYLTTGIGSVTLSFAAPQSYIGLLWGSVDLYNHLTFYDAGNQMVASFSGGDVNAAANGDQGYLGTYYVNISGLPDFTKAVFTSDQYAFEFDNVSYDVDPPVNAPEPLTISLFAAGLAGAASLRRARSKPAPAV